MKKEMLIKMLGENRLFLPEQRETYIEMCKDMRFKKMGTFERSRYRFYEMHRGADLSLEAVAKYVRTALYENDDFTSINDEMDFIKQAVKDYYDDISNQAYDSIEPVDKALELEILELISTVVNFIRNSEKVFEDLDMTSMISTDYTKLNIYDDDEDGEHISVEVSTRLMTWLLFNMRAKNRSFLYEALSSLLDSSCLIQQ